MNDSTQEPKDDALETPVAARSGALSPGGQLTIYSVEAFSAECRSALDGATELSIDLGTVASCDSLGIQLLCALKRTAEGAGKSLRFTNPTAAVTSAAEAIACEALFAGNGRTP